jgi:hypothetical protein
MRTAPAQPFVLWMFIPAVIVAAGPYAVAPAAVAAPCEVVCSDVSIDEGEECGVDISGGCSSVPPTWTPASPGDVFCGIGWADGGTRDTDFYLLCVEDPDGDGVAQLCGTLISDFPGVCFIVDGISEGQCEPVVCEPIAIGHTGCGGDCGNIAVASACVPAPGDYVVFVAAGNCDGSGIFDGYPCDTLNDYQLCITVTNACGDPCGACPTGSACPADLDGDGNVGVVDFLWLLAQWGTDPGGPPDFDGDGTGGISDFLVLLDAWGPCP